jgi:hypothetical protein
MIFTSVARDVGLLQVIRTMTTPEGLDAVRSKLTGGSRPPPQTFEVLMKVSGYKRTNLGAEIIDARAMGRASTTVSPAPGLAH